MQQSKLYQIFMNYSEGQNFKNVLDEFSIFSGISKSEYFLNLSKISFENGDEWSSFAFFLNAFVDNYFVKFFNFYKKDLFLINSEDLIGQLSLLLKTDFFILLVLIVFLYRFIFSVYYNRKVFKKTIFGLVLFLLIGVSLKENISLALLRPQTAFLNSPSKVFFNGEVSGEKDIFLIIGGDKLFVKLLKSNFEISWVQRKNVLEIN